MSNRNKSFRSHCTVDVLLDKENNSVSVDVAYREELLQAPLCWEPHRYYYQDVLEELERQGLFVKEATTGRWEELNNRTVGSRNPRVKASYVFPLASVQSSTTPAPKLEATVDSDETKSATPVSSKNRRLAKKTKINK